MLAVGALLHLALATAPPPSRNDGRIRAWHITDPHVDPAYTTGAPTEGCYCRAHTKCPARPSSAACASLDGATAAALAPITAGPFGNAEADCETPQTLFASSLAAAAAAVEQPHFALFTGDFCAYMLETPCNASATGLEPGSSRAGLLSCITDAYGGVRAAFPRAPVLPSLGNHDTVVMSYGESSSSSGAVFAGSAEMAWLYEAVADLWAQPGAIGCADDAASGGEGGGERIACAEARRTLLLGGYYATRLPGLASSSSLLNLTVLSLNTNYWSVASNPALANASAEPRLLGEGMLAWAEAQLAAAAGRGDKVMVLGHIPPHAGQWSPGMYRRWVTALEPHYRAGLVLPHFFGHMHTDQWQVVRACGGGGTDGTDTGAGTGGGGDDACAGEPLGVMVTGPSVSFSFPAANPAIRLLEFGAEDFALLDMRTYAADLHAANAPGGAPEWALEYSFAETFGIAPGSAAGISPLALAELVQRMAAPQSPEWERYRGAPNGTLFCRGWQADHGKADSHCAQGCTGDCKSEWISLLNGTSAAHAAAPPVRTRRS